MAPITLLVFRQSPLQFLQLTHSQESNFDRELMSLVAPTADRLAVLDGWRSFSANSACNTSLNSWPKAPKTQRNGWSDGHGASLYPKRRFITFEQRTLAHAAK